MSHFQSCAAIGAPGWEAKPGRFHVVDHRLRFTRTIRRVGGSVEMHVTDDTPRAIEKRLRAQSAAHAAALR